MSAQTVWMMKYIAIIAKTLEKNVLLCVNNMHTRSYSLGTHAYPTNPFFIKFHQFHQISSTFTNFTIITNFATITNFKVANLVKVVKMVNLVKKVKIVKMEKVVELVKIGEKGGSFQRTIFFTNFTKFHQI